MESLSVVEVRLSSHPNGFGFRGFASPNVQTRCTRNCDEDVKSGMALQCSNGGGLSAHLHAKEHVVSRRDGCRGGGGVWTMKRSRLFRAGYQSRPLHSMHLWKVIDRDRGLIMARASESDGNGSEKISGDDPKPPVSVGRFGPLFGSVDTWLQVAILIFTAGFLDAGFSGDWSRIGVLSKDIEGDLQMASVGVVPLAAILILSISKRKKTAE